MTLFCWCVGGTGEGGRRLLCLAADEGEARRLALVHLREQRLWGAEQLAEAAHWLRAAPCWRVPLAEARFLGLWTVA